MLEDSARERIVAIVHLCRNKSFEKAVHLAVYLKIN